MDPLLRPIFVVAPPQSGTRFLQRALGESEGVRALGQAGRGVLDHHEDLRPANRDHDSNRRTGADATPEASQRLRGELRDLLGRAAEAEGWEVNRLVDATPRNALRVSFLDALFPDATFVYLYREPRDTLASMMEAWHCGDYVTHPDLPGWPGPPWSLLLVPGWRELAGEPLERIVVHQWSATTRILLDDLAELPPERWCVVDYAGLAADPGSELERLAGFLGIAVPRSWPANLEDFVETRSGKRAALRSERLQAVLPTTRGLAERAHELIAAPVSRRPTPTPDAESPLRSVYTGSLSRILEHLGGSLLVSAPAADRLICIRRDGPRVNTHFRNLAGPTGIAHVGGRICVGGRSSLTTYFDTTRAAITHTDGDHDGYFVPKERWFTGDVGIRDVVYAGDETWFAASRFSCLATRDDDYSFRPRWRPPFVSAVAGDDRCHLSGIATVGDRVAFVTALGESDSADGWRDGRSSSGCVIDVASGEVIARGLSLPHSPRWHDERLWLLESGEGALCEIDAATGAKRTVIELPGFTRGLALVGRLALVGLSKLREGEGERLAVAERFDERFCGVWIVDVDRGVQVGFLRFEDEISEIHDVAFLAGYTFPEVADPADEAAQRALVLPPD